MRFAALLASFGMLACGGSLPRAPATDHPLSAYIEVPYPPPAALAEMVPPEPDRAGVVWIDGEWRHHGGSYVWRRGGWVTPPPASRFAPWRSWYRRDGRLMLAPGGWYDAEHRRLRPPQSVVPAETPANEVTSEFQTGR